MSAERPLRARDHGLVVGLLPTGPGNAITDVPGVGVGHAGPDDHVGVTAIVPALGADHWLRPYFAAAACLNGAGEISGLAQVREWGLAETPILLTATPYVGDVYAAVSTLLAERQPRLGREDVVIPLVAECDPSTYCDVRAGVRPDLATVRTALDAAAGGPVTEGQIGAGVGMHCCDWAGGIGTASRRVSGYTVGVLCLVNFGDAEQLRLCGHPVGRLLAAPRAKGGEGSCVSVVATDAPLLPSQLERVARRPFLGLARAGSYASNGSGEVALAFSTANTDALARDDERAVTPIAMLRNDRLSPLFAAAVEAAEEAVMNALVAGRRLDGATGVTLERFPLERALALIAAGAA